MLREVRKKFVGKRVDPKVFEYDARNDTCCGCVEWTVNDWNEGTSTDYSAGIEVDKDGKILSIGRLNKRELVGDDATRVNYRTRRPDEFDYEKLADYIEKNVLKEE